MFIYIGIGITLVVLSIIGWRLEKGEKKISTVPQAPPAPTSHQPTFPTRRAVE